MNSQILKLNFFAFLFLAFTSSSFAQYTYSGFEVFDTISYTTSQSFYPIDSSKTFGLFGDVINPATNSRDYYFTIYDDPYVVAHPPTFLVNAIDEVNYSQIVSNGFVFLGFNTPQTNSKTFFKIDSTGTVVWTVSIPNSFIVNNYHLINKVSDSGDWVYIAKANNFDLFMVTVNPGGTVLFNGILPNLCSTNNGEYYNVSYNPSSNITIDNQANLFFSSNKDFEFDTLPNSASDEIRTSYKIYKFDKYGNFIWTYNLPSTYSSTGLDAFVSYHLDVLTDTLIVSGIHAFCPLYNQQDSILMNNALLFFDSSGSLISNFMSTDTMSYFDVLYPPSNSINYIGKNLNGNPIFLDQVNDPGYMPLYNPDYWKLPKIIEINVNSLQTFINFDLFQNLYPDLIPHILNFETLKIPYIETDPSGNLSILNCALYTDTTNNSDLITKLFWLQFDVAGNLIHVDSMETIDNWSMTPSLHLQNFFKWKKVRNSNELINYRTYNTNIPFQPHYKIRDKWCFDCTPTVTGKVFLDSLNDCQDLNDAPFQSILLSVDSGSAYLFTDFAGMYEAYLDSGTHTINPIIPYYTFWYSPCNTLPLSVNAPASPNVSTGNDLPVSLLPNVHEIKSYTSGSSPNPGYPTYSTVIVENLGTVTESGLVEFWYTDSIFDFTSATPTPDSISAGYLSWNYSNLPVLGEQYFNIMYSVPPSVSLGSPFEFEVSAGDISIDTFPLNNTDIYQGIVTGSYDPNDKQVFPKGTGPEGYITPQDSLLEYLVRFQNTGTDTAITVRIEDMIDTDLDLGTLQIEMASHPYTVQLQGRKLIFTFNNIMLPDSGANLAASNGFVQYTIEQKPGLPIGTEIKNIAAIYFDFNAPIITNMVTNTIDWATSVTHSNATIESPILKAYPNPFGNSLHLEWNYAEPLLSLTLWNLQGQKVGDFTSLTKGNLSGKVDLGTQSANLPTGIYFLKAETATSLKMLKVVKQ
jgi:hypothetical protein